MKDKVLKPFSGRPDWSKSAPPEYFTWKQDPSKDNLGRLLDKVQPVINKALTSYAGGQAGQLHIKAKLMAVDYLGSFDPKHGMNLNSYLLQNMQSLNRTKADRSYVVHVPENVLLVKNKIFHAENSFQSEKGREPTLEELADMTGVSRKAIERSRSYKSFAPSSATMTEKEDFISGGMGGFDRMWSDYVYFDLDPRDKKIFEWTTGYGGSRRMAKGDIARRLKMSPAAVSFRINKIVGKLEEGARSGH